MVGAAFNFRTPQYGGPAWAKSCTCSWWRLQTEPSPGGRCKDPARLIVAYFINAIPTIP